MPSTTGLLHLAAMEQGMYGDGLCVCSFILKKEKRNMKGLWPQMFKYVPFADFRHFKTTSFSEVQQLLNIHLDTNISYFCFGLVWFVVHFVFFVTKEMRGEDRRQPRNACSHLNPSEGASFCQDGSDTPTFPRSSGGRP